MEIDLDSISIDELQRGDKFPAKIIEGSTRGNLLGMFVNSDGEVVDGFPQFTLRASPGTSLLVDNFQDIEIIEFLGGDERGARAKIVEESSVQRDDVVAELSREIAYRRGELEFEGSLPDIEETDTKQDVEYQQEESVNRTADENKWEERKSEYMKDLSDRI